MKVGDRVEITIAEESYFEVGDKATLTRQHDNGDWQAAFDDRKWKDGDNEFCIQKGIAECKLI